MATAESVGHIQSVAAPPVGLAFAHKACAEGVAACVSVHVVVEQTTAAEVQLARALPVGCKLGTQQGVMARGPGRESTHENI